MPPIRNMGYWYGELSVIVLKKYRKKALRLITNSKYIAHTNPLFCQLNLLKIKDIFKLRLLKFYYKLTCDLLPSYFNTYLDVINRAPPRQLRINLIHQPDHQAKLC